MTIFVTACGGQTSPMPASQAPIVSEDIANVIANYQAEIPQRMQQYHIPGLAIAVVDDQGILWAEGFGYTDLDRRTPVTPSTLSSIQSMSKSFTATAAMFAAQDGLVDLDAPITTYLPNFKVHSIFIALYALCALLFLSALFAWPVRALLRTRREKSGQAHASEAARKGSPWLVLISVLAALAALISLFCLALIALVPYLVYFPWPRPWADLLWWQSAMFRLPFVNLLLGIGVGLLAVLTLRGRFAHWYYLAVGLALLAFNGMILL